MSRKHNARRRVSVNTGWDDEGQDDEEELRGNARKRGHDRSDQHRDDHDKAGKKTHLDDTQTHQGVDGVVFRRRSSAVKGRNASNLSFGDEEDGAHDEEEGEMDRAVTFSKLRNISLARQEKSQEPLLLQLNLPHNKALRKSDEPLLLDLKAGKPQYDAHELEKLKRENLSFTRAASSPVSSGPEIILIGDEAMIAADGEEHPGDGGSSDGKASSIPTAAQIQVAKERRSRAGRLAVGEDYIALEQDTTGGIAAASGNDVEVDEGSRLVREKEEDSDEPFEEHRGATIKFGAPSAESNQDRRRVVEEGVDQEWEEWEREQVRKGAYNRATEMDTQMSDDSRAQRRDKSVSKTVQSATTFKPRSSESIIQAVRKRARDSSERSDTLRQQLVSSQSALDDTRNDLPKLKAALQEASAKYDFLQRIRDYSHNLLDCLQSVLPEITTCEGQLSSLYTERGNEVRSLASHVAWDGPSPHREWGPLNHERRQAIRAQAAQILENVVDEYASCRLVASKFEAFKSAYRAIFCGAYIGDSLVDVFVPFVRWELIGWDAFLEASQEKLFEMSWFQIIVGLFGDYPEEAFLLVLSKSVLPKLQLVVSEAYDPSCRHETARAIEQVEEMLSLFQANPTAVQPLLDAIVSRVCDSLRIDLYGGEGLSALWGLLRVASNGVRWVSVLPDPQGRSLQLAMTAYFTRHVLPLWRERPEWAAQIGACSEAVQVCETLGAPLPAPLPLEKPRGAQPPPPPPPPSGRPTGHESDHRRPPPPPPPASSVK